MENNDEDTNNGASKFGEAMKEKLTGGGTDADAKIKAANDGDESSSGREEGELSSDDDDYHEAGSLSQIADRDPAQVESVQTAPVNLIAEDIRPGKCTPANKSSSTVVSSSYPQLDHRKSSEKNRVPFVISFSDDDTASDSDDFRQNNSASKEKTQGAEGSCRTPQPSVQKSQKIQQNAMKEARVKPREVYLSCPSIPSMNKINGASRSSRQTSGFRNLNHLQKAPGQDPEHKKNVHLNTNKLKLQDLRQLIAIRESQLKLKSTQKTNNSAAGLCSDQSIKDTGNPVKRVRGTEAVDDLQIGTKEPEKKRPKTGKHQSNQLGLDCLKSIHSLDGKLTSGKSVLENCSKQNVDKSFHQGKKDSVGTSHLSHAGRQKQNMGQCLLSAANPLVEKGANVVPDSILADKNAKIEGPVILSDQSGQIRKMAIGDFPEILGTVESTHTHCQDVQMPIQSTGNNALEISDRDQVKSVNEKAYLNNPRFLSCLDKQNMREVNNVDMQSLLDCEELLDKELEEAQEHRHKCEIEERNALKAYRKAQRALMEANARCSHLYNRRELYSVQLRSLMVDNQNLFFSPRPCDQTEAGLKFSNNISDVNVHLKPSSSHCVLAASETQERRASDSNVPSANNAFQNLSNWCVNGQNLSCDPGGEPDGSSSEAPKQDYVTHGVCCSSDDLSRSADEDDELFQFESRSSQDNLESERAPEFNGGMEKYVNDGSEKQRSFECSQDSLLLEASLRSQLFEKLRGKKLFKSGTSRSGELVAERRAENDDGGKMLGIVAGTALPYEAENDKISDFDEGVNKAEISLGRPIQINNQLDIYCSEHTSPSAAEPIDSYLSLESQQSSLFASFLCPTIKSVFIHLKVAEPVGALKSWTVNSTIFHADIGEENADQDVYCQNQAIRSSMDTNEMTALSLCIVGKTGYYSCNLAIDPSWPLCMYELRGKCNNDECPWQHVKDYSGDIMKHDKIDITGCLTDKQSQREELCTTAMVSKPLDHLLLTPPTYVVGSDVLKPDLQSYTSMLVQGYGKCWQKSFSAFLVLSSLFPSVLRSNEPFLHGTEARIEVHNGWNRESSYFNCKNGSENEDQSLDMALLNFNQEANKYKGRIEALKVLVRAIEADPRSAVLWIVYLQTYYCNQKSIGKDDLFQYAVEFNKESYELWLLYINSRVHLRDRLAAYDTALWTLSQHASASDVDALCASQCILDIFLQMMDFLCMTGNVGSAIEKISGHFLTTKRSDESHRTSLPDVISGLNIRDKFIFWVCCVYLVVYKRLPDIVVQRFECSKESSPIDWPEAHVTSVEKQQAALLMEMAVDSLASCMDSESLKNEKTLRAAHLFALNHVRCVSVLEGFECSKNLLEKYIELYPSCLELVLMAAQAEYHMGGLSFHGFEEALRNWPDGVPGVQCIWNQYVECAFQSGKFDLVKELIDRWFCCVWDPHNSCDGVLHAKDGDSSHPSLQPASVSDLYDLFSGYNQNDIVFGMLNFSLYKRLQNDQTEAFFALEQALKTASADTYHHCLRELVLFLLTESIQLNGDARLKRIVNILNVHLIDAQALLATEPLSRGFIQKIKKPRVRQQVSKLLRPVSADFYLMNMVLGVWDSLFLLPGIHDKLMDLVYFVEAMMEILPSNYLLAISVCKVLSKNSNPGNVSPSVSFWASSLLVNSFFHAVPVAPEYAWVEAADVLYNLTDIQKISESFHKKALSVYPFSVRLWKSYLHLSETAGFGNSVKEAAKEKGIELD